MRIVRNSWTLVLAVDTIAAIIPALIMQLFRSDASWHNFLIAWGYGMVYAHSIGTLSFVTLHRLGPRLWRLPKAYTVAGLVVVLVMIAVTGSIVANGIFVALG